MDSIVKRLQENRNNDIMNSVTEVHSNFIGILYEAREYYRQGLSNSRCMAILEALENDPDADIEEVLNNTPEDDEVLVESPMDNLGDVHLYREKDGSESVEVFINGVSYRYVSPTVSSKELLRKFNAQAKYSRGVAYANLKKNSVLYYNGRTKTFTKIPGINESLTTINVMKNGNLTTGRIYSNKKLVIEDEVFVLTAMDIEFLKKETDGYSKPADYGILVTELTPVTKAGFLEESKKLNESVDVEWFELKPTSPLYKSAIRIASRKTGIKEVQGFQLNDFEPSDVVIKYSDNSYSLIDLSRNKETKFANKTKLAHELEDYGIWTYPNGLLESKSTLSSELKKLQTGSSHIVSKYKLTSLDIRELMDLVSGKSKETINSKVVKVLSDYGIKTKVKGIGWVVESIQSDAEKKRRTRKPTGNLIYNKHTDMTTMHPAPTSVEQEVSESKRKKK